MIPLQVKIRTQSNTLPNTDDDTSSNETSNVPTWRECLEEGRNDREEGAQKHAKTTALPVGQRSTKEETCDDGSNSVCGVDSSDDLGTLGQSQETCRLDR